MRFRDVWAPKYRQAAFGAFLLKSQDAHKALDLAYRDVLAAFDAFLAAQPAGKPIILAGHSQGSLHLLRLLAGSQGCAQGPAGRGLYRRLAGRRSDRDLPATGPSACTRPDQAGCVLSWQSFKEPANPRW